MFSNYSWSVYITAVAVVILIYYFLILAVYYQKEIKALVAGRTKFRISKAEVDKEKSNGDFDKLESVVSDLKRNIFDQAGKEPDKTALLIKLRYRLANYEGIDTAAFRVAINHFIIQQAKENCGVAYSERELDSEWEKLPR